MNVRDADVVRRRLGSAVVALGKVAASLIDMCGAPFEESPAPTALPPPPPESCQDFTSPSPPQLFFRVPAPEHEDVELLCGAVMRGFKHFDVTAAHLPSFLAALDGCDVPRSQLFLAMRVKIGMFPELEMTRLKSLLRTSRLDHFDLVILEFLDQEQGAGWQPAWRSLGRLFDSGKAKALGVSNVNITELWDLVHEPGALQHL